MKKLMSFVLLSALCLSISPVTTFAEDTTSSGEAETPINTTSTVTLDVPVAYTVVVPKIIVIDPLTKMGKATVKVKNFNGDQAENPKDRVSMTVPTYLTFEQLSAGNYSLPVSVTNEPTSNHWFTAGNGAESESGQTKQIIIDATSVKINGSYSVSLNLNFQYEKTSGDHSG